MERASDACEAAAIAMEKAALETDKASQVRFSHSFCVFYLLTARLSTNILRQPHDMCYNQVGHI